jgi:hypothetical protein
VSLCTQCGQDHDPTSGVCPGATSNPGANLQTSGKTMFGVPPAPVPPTAKPVQAKSAFAATMIATPVRLPAPKHPIPRLPSAEEVRRNPNLVISLEVTPPPSQPSAPRQSGGNSPQVSPAPPGSDTTVDLPDVGPPVDLPPAPVPGLAVEVREGTPTDLPKPGSGPRFVLPEPPPIAAGDASGQGRTPTAGSFGERLTADVKSVVSLLGWASTLYLGRPTQLFVLAAFLVLPTSILQSCLVAGVTSRSTSLAPYATTVDFSARKAELALRIQQSHAQGQLDQQAAAELAALTATETARPSVPTEKAPESLGWLRERLAFFIQGLLILGLAFPIACGILAVALFDRESGAALPAFADVWPILVSRGELFLVTLLPAALLVALGHALFVLPGLVLSTLFLFLPHVVLFEKKGGRNALERSIALTKGDPVRTVLTLLSFALAGFAVALLTELLLPTSGTRAVAFLHFITCDLLAVAFLPIPALVLARIYLDLRGRSGANPESLSRAARS